MLQNAASDQGLHCLPFIQHVLDIENVMKMNFTGPRVKCHVGAIKSLHILHYSAVFVFIFLGIIGPILVSWNTEFCLSQC